MVLLTHGWEDKGVHTFPKGICPKVNVIARLEYELAYYDSTVYRINHYTSRTPPINLEFHQLDHKFYKYIPAYFSGNLTISTQDGTSLKLVDKFTYLGSSVSSTEKDIDTRLTKAWTAIDSLSIYGNQTWPIKWNAVSSRQRSYRYCCMDAPLGR